MTDRVENIEQQGVSRRRNAGIASLILGIVATVLLIALGVSRWWRLALIIPFAGAASGFLQARERT